MEKKTIGSFLAALRRANGLTQQEVAERLNVSNKTVSKWERDESCPEITLIPVLAELFRVTADEILKGERIATNEVDAEKTAAKIDKQIKRIINSIITRFKNISYIALALVLTGCICFYTITRVEREPVIALGALMLCLVVSVTLELIQINLTNLALKDNDLVEDVAASSLQAQLQKAHLQKSRYTFGVFYANIAVAVLAPPYAGFTYNIILNRAFWVILPLIGACALVYYLLIRK